MSIATVGILMLANSELLDRPRTRDTVEYWVRTLVSEAEKPDSAIIFPYNFSFYLHGLAQEQNDAPWYSALAQGEFLELLTRLYVATGKPEYLEWAKRVFRPFVDVRPYSENRRSIAHIDGSGYYWADEYPNKGRPDLTLNGYMYAIRGVYEYWLLTGDPDAERVVRAAMTTFKRYHQQFRAPGGGPSSYCLRHPQIVSGPYHRQIVLLFMDYYRMSGDAVFSQASEDFKSDYWPD